MSSSIPLVALASLAVACTPATPGANPHDMSAGQHEAHAREHEQNAAQHQAQYDPKASEATERCVSPSARKNDVASDACWTSTRNPTAEHLKMAKEHARHAADHRTASAALRQAEASSCVGIGQADRDTSPFVHIEDIESVEPLAEPSGKVKPPTTETIGAIVTFRAVEGMTVEWLQHIVDCHLARNAALGHQVPEMPDCPLVPKGVEAKVSSTGTGFAVRIRSNDPASAQEALARAQRLVKHDGHK